MREEDEPDPEKRIAELKFDDLRENRTRQELRLERERVGRGWVASTHPI